MNQSIKLIAGLGNPGQQYAGTRHNVGAELVATLARQCNVTLTSESRFHGSIARVTLSGTQVRLLIPDTYMNHSGRSVAAVVNYYKIPVAEVLVVHDELDLPPGAARFKHGGGHGGHNGLRDIVSALGNKSGFSRLRIGIGHPGNAREVSNYVLTRATPEELQQTERAIDEAVRVLPVAVAGDWARATKDLHTATPEQARTAPTS